jgi:dipeptidyl aminopeptidase/acylaminoacyl peptidase
MIIAVIPQVSRSQGTAAHALTLDDLAAIREVSDPQISPDGDWVAYTVRTTDVKDDKKTTDIWMTNWEGDRTIQLTFTKDSEASPRWSPDGRYLGFLSSRGGESEASQVWLLNRRGGEAEKITEFKGGVSDYVWSPDAKRLVLVVQDPDPDAIEDKDKEKEKKPPNPIVIDRYQFKQDIVGYLGKRRQHLYLFDVASRKVEPLTTGEFNETQPSWSPDGSAIAFVSKRGAGDPDRHSNYDIYTIDARAGASARQVTTYDGADCAPGFDSRPAWSPDGKLIAYVQGGPKELIDYGVRTLAVIPASGGTPKLPAPRLDRNVSRPRWSSDGSAILFLLEDDRTRILARVSASGGSIETVLGGRIELGSYDLGPESKVAVLRSTPLEPFEVFALAGAQLRPLSRLNRDLFSRLRLGQVEEINFQSEDGTAINGFVVKPPDYQPGRKYPTLLRIHGGPVSQFANGFSFEWQLLAARGYVVVAANPRGSSGRGQEFSRAIFADWGNKDVHDVLAAVDYVIAQGIADPNRLGIGGWSYGGMLTNYTIARDSRFKAAVSGASISNILAGYGTDQYIRDYEAELGPPWRNRDAWLRISFPFLNADRIITPTLFLCGEKDFNVPLLNSEQMYQALRSLNRDTQLIIYPGQFHGLTRPSYIRDRYERYLEWYAKYLKPDTKAQNGEGTGRKPLEAGKN